MNPRVKPGPETTINLDSDSLPRKAISADYGVQGPGRLPCSQRAVFLQVSRPRDRIKHRKSRVNRVFVP